MTRLNNISGKEAAKAFEKAAGALSDKSAAIWL
jgi:hypothetical protein